MKSKIQRWGNSLALRIPRSFASEIGLKQNSSVELSIMEGKLAIVPIDKKKIALEKLLAQVTEENIHYEIDTGPPVGRESW